MDPTLQEIHEQIEKNTEDSKTLLGMKEDVIQDW